MIVLDTDFVSVLAKAEIIELVKKLFSGKHDLIITPKVYEELNVPKEHGYTYPDEIFKSAKVAKRNFSFLDILPSVMPSLLH